MLTVTKPLGRANVKPADASPATPSVLMRLKEEWDALLVRDEDLTQRRDPLEDRAEDLISPRLSDPALLYRDEDADLHLTCGIPKPCQIGDDPAWYHGGFVNHLRSIPQGTSAAQSRAAEIISAWERRRGEQKGIARALGLDLINAEYELLMQEMGETRRRIMSARASTLEEACFKARVVLWCGGNESVRELNEEVEKGDPDDCGMALSIVRDLLLMEDDQGALIEVRSPAPGRDEPVMVASEG